MNILLHERSPRPWSLAYGLHRLRAVAEVQFDWLLPLAAAFGFAAAGMLSGAQAGTDSLPGLLAAAALAGIPAGFGVAALWTWLAARLLPWLTSHPQSQASIKTGYRLPPRPEAATPVLAIGECHPTRRYTTTGGYELDYSTAEQYSATPEWSSLPAQSSVTGLLVLGNTGSGKTAFVLKPAIFRLFHHASRPGGLVMDSKASLVDPLTDELAAADRAADLLRIGPAQATNWNPFHQPLVLPATLADMAMVAIENINGAKYGADSRWIRNGAAHLLEGLIGLLRLRTNYVTATALRFTLNTLIQLTAGAEQPGDEVDKWIKSLFSGHSSLVDQSREYEHYSSLIISRFSEDEKFRAIYCSELQSLLVPLTSPEVIDKFNSPETDLNMPAWSEVINQGLIIVLDCNNRIHPALSIVLGMLLKLGYQDAMLARLDWQRKGICNDSRYMLLCIDEYQEFASPNDASYLALCRESKSISTFLTQGFDSIIEKIGEEKAKVLLQSMRNRLILSNSVPKFAAELLGESEFEEVDRNIQENMQDAALNATGKFAGESTVAESLSVRQQRKHVVAPEILATLPLGQGILQCHNGVRSLPIHRVFLTPSGFSGRHADLKLGE